MLAKMKIGSFYAFNFRSIGGSFIGDRLGGVVHVVSDDRSIDDDVDDGRVGVGFNVDVNDAEIWILVGDGKLVNGEAVSGVPTVHHVATFNGVTPGNDITAVNCVTAVDGITAVNEVDAGDFE